MPREQIKDRYSPASWLLYEYRISHQQIADQRRPKRSRISISFELSGRNALTEETLDAISELAGGNVQLVNDVRRLARESFIERNPQRPERHAFLPKRDSR